MKRSIAALLVVLAPTAALAQAQASGCPSPAFEKRFIASVAVEEPKSSTKLPAAKGRAYAQCYLRVVCSRGLDKAEFEMYVLSHISSYGDEKADDEYNKRFRRDAKKNQSAMDKVNNLNAIRDACLREIGV